MIKRIYSYLFLACFITMIGLAGCSTSTENTENADVVEVEEEPLDTAAIKAQLDELRNEFMAMVESGNYEPMGRIAHPDFMAFGPNGPLWDVYKGYATGGPYPAGAKLVISPMETVIIDETWGYELGTSETTYLPEGAEEAMILHDTYLMLFKNEGNGWQIYREVATAELPY